ncbi:MAG: hypothetical protein JGK17_32205 [Microcoleus sp. PH2017_10_PVI_O_A]|uniref:hypothetical protein n=1 Tax=unclassified Microcoleus TaxID=2642155 RepID=UPI001D9D17FC|nr:MULTISPECIES: hypothetical protein [unclassified Microcoleus]TAE86858.1 MAG: hypothetical protein EAZ83_00090 [Oscillatoriales cyanobacterium]MCC3410116.1 hypothetical protein [Microcoleus sp. PH2017_10_PVI_O_A]MCC3464383.1 hypothetical protein [Microcoleus sp. PH2017_11_PCY_U_A]MCC3482716.1 hypothetical protein [Microcoleus sp. PH2017_12_PCY_D_A]MCC3532547.1 hypothetical protein [Microcoleus sp. PH2017_21_RUC_O_A]
MVHSLVHTRLELAVTHRLPRTCLPHLPPDAAAEFASQGCCALCDILRAGEFSSIAGLDDVSPAPVAQTAQQLDRIQDIKPIN